MKTHLTRSRHLTNVLAAGLLCAGLGASAVPVTFSVNMSEQSNLGVFENGTHPVTARGSFNGWGNSFVLTNSPANTNVFSGTIDIATGTVAEWKYVFNNGTGDTWELSGAGGFNRYFKVGNAAMVLPTGWFDNMYFGGRSVAVKFAVDMGIQIRAGNFKPETDAMELRGTINAWSSGTILTPNAANTNIYEGTFDVFSPPGAVFEYKFEYLDVNLTEHWENLVGYNPRNNRSFIVPESGALDLGTVYFSDATGYPIKAAVAFQVDMGVQDLMGNFDPSLDQVWVRGSEVGWNDPPLNGFQLFEDASRPGIYTNTWTKDTQIVDTPWQYKYTIWPTDTMVEIWEDGDNKSFVFTGSEPTNPQGYHLVTTPLTFFNNVTAEGLLPADTLVTYRVDMNGAQGHTGTPVFDPGAHGVWFNGTVLSNSWDTFGTWGTKPVETQMVDDGTGGDAVAGDKIYSWQMLVPAGKAIRTQYKYGIESQDNEAPPLQDHVRYIRSTGTYVMPVDKFGTQTVEPELGDLKVVLGTPGNVNVTWLGGIDIRLQSADSLTGTWTDVSGTVGAHSATVASSGTQKFFRLHKP